jgi:hypothetical protein
MKNAVRPSVLTLAMVSLLTVQAQAARFWGSQDEVCPDIHTDAGGNCYNIVVTTYYVFWIAVSSESHYEPTDCP